MPNGHGLATTPYPTPAPGEPVRLALLGHRAFASFCPSSASSPGLEPLFLECKPGVEPDQLRGMLAGFRPHAVVVFDPAPGADVIVEGVAAATLAFLCGSLPQLGSGSRRDALLTQIAHGPRPGFDRILSCDPLATDAANASHVWRSVPLPINDQYYREVRAITGRARSLFVGRSTEYRERILMPAKHHHDLLHVVSGLDVDELSDLLASHDVGVNIHAEPGLGFSSRTLMHLAAGHLLISEPLAPAHGLEINIDYLELAGPGMLVETLERLERFPDTYHATRVRGRLSANEFRASRVYPRLLGDLFDDLAAFGTERD